MKRILHHRALSIFLFSYFMLTSSSWSGISPIVSKGFARPFQPSGILPSALRQHPLPVEAPPQGPLLPEGKDTRDQCDLSSQAPHILSLTSNSSSHSAKQQLCSAVEAALPEDSGATICHLCEEAPPRYHFAANLPVTHSTFSKENPIQTFSLFFPFVLVPFIDWHWAAAQVADP